MVLWFSKEEKPKKEEIEKIKKSIERGNSGIQGQSEAFRRGSLAERASPLEVEDREIHGSVQTYAPLFVKLDKYHTIMNRIKALDEILRNTIEIMKLNDELERVRNEVTKHLLRNLHEAVKIVNFLNQELGRPLPFIEEPKEYTYTPEVENLEEHLNHLKKQLEELKKYF